MNNPFKRNYHVVIESDDAIGAKKISSHFTQNGAKEAQKKLPRTLISDVGTTKQIDEYNADADKWRDKLDFNENEDIDSGWFGMFES